MLLFFHLPLKWAFVLAGRRSRMAGEQLRKSRNPSGNGLGRVSLRYNNLALAIDHLKDECSVGFELSGDHRPPASGVVIDDTGVL